MIAATITTLAALAIAGAVAGAIAGRRTADRIRLAALEADNAMLKRHIGELQAALEEATNPQPKEK